jgi:hypothetical protein
MGFRRLLIALCTFTALAAATPAQAKDLNGRFGLGLEQSLGGVSGVTLRYWPGAKFGILATIGADVLTQTDFKFLNTKVAASAGFVYNFAESLHANLGAGLRLAIGFETNYNSSEESDGAVFQFDIELPVMTEFFLSDSFSVSLAVGVVIAMIPLSGAVFKGAGVPDTESYSAETIHFGIGSFTSQLGIVYYF